MRVWIAQCLCPARHAIMACAGTAETLVVAYYDVLDPLREAVEAALRSRAINPWCGLCSASSDNWRYEIGVTRFRTMEEAAPTLRRLEAENAAARQAFGSDLPRLREDR